MFFKYRYLLVSTTSLVICQIIKFIIESLKYHTLRFDRLFNGSGGIPSSHTTFSTSLSMYIMLEHGLSSELFAISLVFSLIVMYDAIGIRYEAGMQASTINDIASKLGMDKQKSLKEELGHKPCEVLVGIILGCSISLLYYYLIF